MRSYRMMEIEPGRYRCANGQTVRLTDHTVLHYPDGSNWPGFVGTLEDGSKGLWHLDGKRSRNGLSEQFAAAYDIVRAWTTTDAIIDEWLRWR